MHLAFELTGAIEEAAAETRRALREMANAASPRETADWALVAKNSAATLHSLLGARNTARRS